MDYVDLTPTSRLVIDTDPDAPDPRADDCVCGAYTPRNWWGGIADGPLARFDFPGDLASAHERLYDARSWTPERKVQRWAWANFNIVVERHDTTYWWCDRAAFDAMVGGEFTRERQADVIGADVRAHTRWARGEARLITFQRKATFKRVTKRWVPGADDLFKVWEDIRTEGNVYLDDYTPGRAALDFFPDLLTKKELTVVTAMIDSERA
jgi:hypothetical protein